MSREWTRKATLGLWCKQRWQGQLEQSAGENDKIEVHVKKDIFSECSRSCWASWGCQTGPLCWWWEVMIKEESCFLLDHEIWMTCMSVQAMPTEAGGEHLSPLELELLPVVNHQVGAGNQTRSSAKTVSSLKHWDTSPAPRVLWLSAYQTHVSTTIEQSFTPEKPLVLTLVRKSSPTPTPRVPWAFLIATSLPYI